MHDFGCDGNLLPDTITRVHAVRSSNQRAAQLAADHIDIDTAVGLADIAVRYPKHVTFLHVKDSHGDKDATLALLLIPTETEPGINMDSLKESTMFGGATFLEVPVPVTMQAITQKLALQAKRALIDHWCFDKECPRDAGQRFSLSKTCRGQVGVELHQIWLKDLAKTCDKKCLYIVDLVCGSGEIAKACVDVKISEEASSQNVRVCSWSHDPRSSFHELAWARCGTHLGKLYLQNKLQMLGHNPVPAPGDVPRKTRKMVRALMGGPLRVLSLRPRQPMASQPSLPLKPGQPMTPWRPLSLSREAPQFWSAPVCYQHEPEAANSSDLPRRISLTAVQHTLIQQCVEACNFCVVDLHPSQPIEISSDSDNDGSR
jgi:hypothetical protein